MRRFWGAAPCEVITLACALPEIGSTACGPLHVHWPQIRIGTVGKCWLGGAADEHGPVECPGLCLAAGTVGRLGGELWRVGHAAAGGAAPALPWLRWGV